MAEIIYAGIDISAGSLAVIRCVGDGNTIAKQFPNTAAGHGALVDFLTGGDAEAPVRVCLEPSGIYGLDVALHLHGHSTITVLIPNPRAARNFAHALMSRSKTDPLDAQVLLEFARRMPLAPWQPPSRTLLQLREVSRYGATLTQSLVVEKNRLHKANATRLTPAIIIRTLEQHIAQIEQDIKAMEAYAHVLIAADADCQRAFQLLLTVPGVGRTTAIQVLPELLAWPRDMRPKQWVAMAGLDVRETTSGTSVHRKPGISKAGNRRIRRALYMPALVAIRRNRSFRAFYDRLTGKGKKARQAIVAVMRKLLHAIHGVLHHNTPFNEQQLFPTFNSP